MNRLSALVDAARLYEMRDAARTILGDRYDDEIGKVRPVIARVMEREGCNELAAAIRLCRPTTRPAPPALVVATIFAAALEMIEGDPKP